MHMCIYIYIYVYMYIYREREGEKDIFGFSRNMYSFNQFILRLETD